MSVKPAHQEQHKTHTPNSTPRHTVPGRGPGAITGRRFKWYTKHTWSKNPELTMFVMLIMLIHSEWSFRFVLLATSKKVWNTAMFWRAYCPSRDKNRGENSRKYWSWSGINTHLRPFVLVCNPEFTMDTDKSGKEMLHANLRAEIPSILYWQFTVV